jgi:hypothetical protein
MHPAFVEERFISRAENRRGLGVFLLGIAAVLWVYAAWQMFSPYETEGGTECDAPVVAEREASEDGLWKSTRCATERDWPRPVTALLLATPLATAGGALYATGAASVGLRRHEQDVERARG